MARAENEECAMTKEADALLLHADQAMDFGFYFQTMNTLKNNNHGDGSYRRFGL